VRQPVFNSYFGALKSAALLSEILDMQTVVFGERELDIVEEGLSDRAGDALKFSDLGCGNGSFTLKTARRFAGKYEGSTFTGGDNNSALIKAAKILASEHPSNNVRFIEQDIITDDLELSIGVADVIIVRLTLQHLDGVEDILSRIYSAMKKGAMIFVIEGVFEEYYEPKEDSIYNDFVDGMIEFYRRVGSDYRMWKKIPALLESVGFSGIVSKKTLHTPQNTNNGDFAKLIIGVSVLINSLFSDIFPETFRGELENYLTDADKSESKIVTTVIRGIKE